MSHLVAIRKLCPTIFSDMQNTTRRRTHRFVDWEHLPKRGYPIIFHGVKGEDMREANWPSWFNPDEAQIVKMYAELLVKSARKNRCKPKDIGIIAPYHKKFKRFA